MTEDNVYELLPEWKHLVEGEDFLWLAELEVVLAPRKMNNVVRCGPVSLYVQDNDPELS